MKWVIDMRLGKRKRCGFNYFIVFFVIVLAFSIFMAASAIARRLQPTFVSQAHSYANTMVTDVIENAVNDVLSNGDYSETTKTKNDNSTTTVESDNVKINKLKSELTVKIQNDIAEKCNAKINVPLGSASGFYILSGVGPKIPISIYPAAIVNTNYKENFESAGINQVRHTVAINVDVTMRYSGYMLDETETINTDVPVVESIIIGSVPNYYGTGQIGISAE
jgi:sporulation protein YunB